MQLLEVIILAIVQALTEFIPVSSSGHLLAIQQLTDIKGSLALDVMLHFGTLIALVIYFWPRLIELLNLKKKANKTLLRNIIISTIPAVVAGLLFENIIETSLRSVYVVIVALIVVGVMMVVADHEFTHSDVKKGEQLPPDAAFTIGFFQALALIPGTSRSGITMLAARARGMSNRAAAEYSFLIGIPIIFGATLKVLLESETRQLIADDTTAVLAGVVTAALFGLVAIRFLLSWLSRHGLAFFGYYRIGLAFVLLLITILQRS